MDMPLVPVIFVTFIMYNAFQNNEQMTRSYGASLV